MYRLNKLYKQKHDVKYTSVKDPNISERWKKNLVLMLYASSGLLSSPP